MGMQMFSAIRRRLTYTNVAMTLALVFAMSGGAYAASKYVITSTKQISPKVLKSLVGKTGKTGAAGAQGPAGANGPAGPAGPAGSVGKEGPVGKGEKGEKGDTGAEGKEGKAGTTGFTKTLPRGATETGTWSIHGTTEGEEPFIPLSFAIPLEKGLEATQVQVVGKTGNGTTCPGTAEAPAAAEGNLCVYEGENFGGNVELPSSRIFQPHGLEEDGAGAAGAILVGKTTGLPAIALGSWAVTAE
jgi:collagen triple helix repeat protein